MKLDLIAVRKLSPAGLWDLAELSAVISILMDLIAGGFGGGSDWAVSVRRAAGMVNTYRRQLSARTLENFNMRAKAWVLQCPERTAHVRGVIGEAAIKRWQKNRLLDYAFTKAFGDWKAAFPNGVRRTSEAPRQVAERNYKNKIHGYNWKPFALVKIPNAARILFGQDRPKPASDSEAEEQRAAYLKLWGVDIADTHEYETVTRPRSARTMNPVRFTPYELVPEAATGMLETIEDAASETGGAKIYPPPKLKLLSAGAHLNSKENTAINIEDPKPP